jgi:thiol-disulfide isomerase/thioredoxin
MFRTVAVVVLLFLIGSLEGQQKNIPVIGFKEFEQQLNHTSDTIYVLNFWATWCGPCRKELPEFQKIHEDYSHKKIKVLLVSLDFLTAVSENLPDYLFNNHITAPVVVLNEPDANSWIDRVDPSWSGSLPATLIYRKNQRMFFDKELTYQDIINSFQLFN